MSQAPGDLAPVGLGLRAIDHVELWVGNARQAAHFYRGVLGFAPVAYAGPETGVADRVSHVLAQGEIRVVLTGALAPDHPVATHVRRHGDGVRRIAFRVDDAARARDLAVARGATPRGDVQHLRGDRGEVAVGVVAAYGDTEHAFVSRSHEDGPWMRGFVPAQPRDVGSAVGLTLVDHVVANVPAGRMASWARWHERVLGLRPVRRFAEDVSTPRSALASQVMADDAGRVKLPINEPVRGPRRSQIDEFLDAYGGPGIQHLALATDDIVATVAELRRRGLAFLPAPPDYHERARDRVGEVGASWERLREHGILVDRDERGHLLQIFTEPLQDRPTLFFELIQRDGATGFGAGNFRALFESMEREQERRGNL